MLIFMGTSNFIWNSGGGGGGEDLFLTLWRRDVFLKANEARQIRNDKGKVDFKNFHKT